MRIIFCSIHIGLFDTDWRGHHTLYVDLLSGYFTDKGHLVTFVTDKRHEQLDELPNAEPPSVVTRPLPGEPQAPVNFLRSVQDQYFQTRQLQTTLWTAGRREFNVPPFCISTAYRFRSDPQRSPRHTTCRRLRRFTGMCLSTFDSGSLQQMIGAVTKWVLDATLEDGTLDFLTIHADSMRNHRLFLRLPEPIEIRKRSGNQIPSRKNSITTEVMSTPSVAVIHHELDVGGGESVCFHILDELQYRYDLHLYSLNRPDFGRLNEAFGTDVTDVTVHVPQTARFGTEAAKSIGSAIFQDDYQVPAGLKLVLLSRQYSSEWRRHGLRISTYGEFPLSPPAIQYIHHPFLNRWDRGGHFEIEGALGGTFNKLYTRLSGATRRVVQQSKLLTNSSWTANQIESIYNRPDVVYPPVAVNECPNTPWEEREDGFLLLGRVSADKQSYRAISILDGVRERGHEVHLHVVGKIETKSEYGKRMADAIAQREWITVEGYVPQDVLFSMIREHKWGIHTKEYEHFGMAVAEQVAGGALPFVPNTGGQVEIVGGDPQLCYESLSDAINKIERLIANPSQCKQKLDQLPDVTEQFGEGRFKKEIRERVDKEFASYGSR